jgi:[CysO sulfur-carrier protein]-S-L-cysteine hydrolase
VLPQELADDLVAHARSETPNECCGLIAGQDGVAKRVFRVTNTEASPFMYVMDPREQLRIMDDIDDAGWDLLAIYHSHTKSAAYPSRTDVELAFYPTTAYLIVSLADRDRPEIRAFHLSRTAPEGRQIHEVPVEIR